MSLENIADFTVTEPAPATWARWADIIDGQPDADTLAAMIGVNLTTRTGSLGGAA